MFVSSLSPSKFQCHFIEIHKIPTVVLGRFPFSLIENKEKRDPTKTSCPASTQALTNGLRVPTQILECPTWANTRDRSKHMGVAAAASPIHSALPPPYLICTSKRKWAQAPLLERLVAFLSKSSFLLPLEKPPDIFVPLQQQGPSSTNLKARPIALVRLGMEAIDRMEGILHVSPTTQIYGTNGLLPQADAPEPLTWITTCYTNNCPRPVGTKKVTTPR